VIVFGGIGIFMSYFYTAPPLDLGAKGLGEADVAVSFFMLAFCSFFVATIEFDWGTLAFTGAFQMEIFIFAVIIGTLVGMMRLTDSMSGQEAHIANGEKSISVRLGLDGAVKLAMALIIFVYFLVAVMVYFNPAYLLLFLTLPLTMKAWKIMAEKGAHWCLKVPPFFFGTAFLTEILFITAIAVKWLFDIGSLF
jgi:1,4-dihydroxy-2-naphthoate octaprenyltransferase